MAEMKYLPLFYDVLDDYIELDDASFGKVVRAALAYMKQGEEPNGFTLAENFAFKSICKSAKRSADKYEARCEKNRQNIQKRWESKKQSDTNVYDGIPTNTSEYETIPTDTKNTKNKEQRIKSKENTSSNDVCVEPSDEASTPPKSKPKKKEYAPLPPPTVDEVRAYCDEKGITNVNPEHFVQYYEAAIPAWTKANGEPVKNWKLTVVTWSQHPVYGNQKPQQTGGYVPQPDDYPF